jgi:hypothetical protein
MSHRRQQSISFGWVFVIMTAVGAAGGAAAGLYTHSIRTSGVLPVEETEPFESARYVVASEYTQSIPRSHEIASVPREIAAAQQEAVPHETATVPQQVAAVAAGSPWFDEPALFSPVPAYPVADAAPAASQRVAAAPPAAQAPAPKPSAQSAQNTAAARHAATRPGKVLNDAQIASIKKRLKLTPDQEPLWPAVETALRNVSYSGKAAEVKVASAGNAPMAYVDTNSAEVLQLKYAALPLIMRLNDDQKREVKSMAYVMGLGNVAAGF